jgi:uncharacterized membrane protein
VLDTNRQRALRRKSGVFAFIAVLGNVFGNVLLRAGMLQVGPTVSFSPLVYLRGLSNPLVDAGIVLLTIWFLSNLSLLSWADLSYVLPVTAIGYAGAALLGWAALGESVSVLRCIGIGLITFGGIMVGRTQPHTFKSPLDES